MRSCISDEVLPELTRLLRNLRRRLQAHQSLLESLGHQRPGKRFFDYEDNLVTALAQNTGDPDTVIRRSEGALREEDHGSWRPVVGHQPRRSSAQRPGRRARSFILSGSAMVGITRRVVNWLIAPVLHVRRKQLFLTQTLKEGAHRCGSMWSQERARGVSRFRRLHGANWELT